MFASSDPFIGVETLVPPPTGGNGLNDVPATQPITPTTLVVPDHRPTPIQPVAVLSSRRDDPRRSPVLPVHRAHVQNVAGPSSRHENTKSPLVSPMRHPQVASTKGGWYVAHNAVLPGVYRGS